MKLKDTILEKQVARTALLGPTLMAFAFAIAAVQAHFSLQPLMWLAAFSMLASWKWKLKGWYVSVVVLSVSLWFLPEYSFFSMAFALALVLSSWITAEGYAQIEVWMKELMVEGAKQHVTAVGQLEKQVSALQHMEAQKELAIQRIRQELQDSKQQTELCEQELKQYRGKADELIAAYESKEASLLQQVEELHIVQAKLIEESSLQKQKAQLCEELENKCAEALNELEQWKQKAHQCNDIEMKYARALSDIEQWQLRVQQLMELSPSQAVETEVPQEQPAEEGAALAVPMEAEEPKVEAAKPKAKTTAKGKGAKNKKTNHWANAILSRWSEPQNPSQ